MTPQEIQDRNFDAIIDPHFTYICKCMAIYDLSCYGQAASFKANLNNHTTKEVHYKIIAVRSDLSFFTRLSDFFALILFYWR